MLSFIAIVLAVTALTGTTGDVLPMHDGRIVGGVPTDIEKFPHQVSLEGPRGHFCGGSIYSHRYIITAAHCVYSKTATDFKTRVGTSRRESAGKLYELEWLKYNPTFTMAKLDGDVAVLKLTESIVFGPTAQPVKLVAESNEPSQGDMLTVTGWGTLGSGGNYLPTVLQAVRVPSIGRQLCRLAYGESKVTEAMICAGVSRKDSCQGDSGGPLVNEKRELVGIVSFGKGCGSPGYPGIYANVANSSVRNFILENTLE